MLSTPSLVLPLTLTAPASTAERRGEIPPHRIEIRQQLRLLRDHRHVDVRHRVAGLANRRDRAFQQLDAVGALPFRIGIGKHPADVAGAGRAKDRVRHRVTDNVGIGVSVETELEWNRDAGEDQRTSRNQAMQVVAVADADMRATAEAVAVRTILRRR